MNEKQLRRLIGAVDKGRVSRRSFIQKMVALGLTAPMASQMLMHAGVAVAQTPSEPGLRRRHRVGCRLRGPP